MRSRNSCQLQASPSSADGHMTRGQIAPCQAQSTITTAATVRYKVLFSSRRKHSPEASGVVMLCQHIDLSDIIMRITLDSDLERPC
jgi:hypothetical protein